MFPKTIAAAISIIFLLVSSPALAQHTTVITSTSVSFTFLTKGEAAPFDGALFTPEATAKILEDATTADQRCTLRINKQVALVRAKCEKDLDLLANTFASEMRRAEIKITQKDKEIEQLSELASKNDYNWLWGTGGIVSGILLTVGVVYVVGLTTE